MNINTVYFSLRSFSDRFLALVLLFILSPILVAACVFVKMDKGPIFFLQKRLGKDAKEFSIIKLRTMIVNADKYLDVNGMPTRKRTTWVGGFLRKSSIDELPQLINILKGDMSLIGPRPILPRMLPYMTAFEKNRFRYPPGVTGLAQVKGRNKLKWSHRFRYDVFYVSNMSLSLDIYIAIWTCKSLFGSENISVDVNRDQVDDVTTRLAEGA